MAKPPQDVPHDVPHPGVGSGLGPSGDSGPPEIPDGSRQHVTRLLREAEAGDERAARDLLPLVYAELRDLARRRMAEERSDHTLSATALVHEAYLRLVGREDRPRWQG